ncbi:MAG: CYTH domain-containing protein [Spirochaetaceae bacterium]|nr:CYTH domain-containing protein [Spirochaetaceae bacterium]
MFEIELKAWVDDFAAVKQKIGTLAEFTADFEKEDVYWFPPPRPETGGLAPLPDVRVRKETFKPKAKETETFILVTYKIKEIRAGIEVNDEKEFVISAPPDAESGVYPAGFEELLSRLGFSPKISKKKQGSVWKYGGEAVSIELSSVDKLGNFVELEIMAADNEAKTVNAARERLFSLLKLIGISEEKIEKRYYSDMLSSGVRQ